MSRLIHHLTDSAVESSSAIIQIKNYLKSSGLIEGDRLPAERDLAVKLSLTRGALRQALAVLESSGYVWRRVGKGTFIAKVNTASDDDQARQLARVSNPIEVIEARLVLEPKLAAFAAIRGSEQDFAQIGKLLDESKASCLGPESQKKGDEFHYAVARAANNSLLFALFETLFRVRSVTSWGRLRPALATKKELLKVWDEHTQIFEAIKMRDHREASRLMHIHIESIQKRIALGHEVFQESVEFE
ncbi:MAG: FCD domain-containing protein [Pseudomonadota bacterium]